MKHNVLTMSMSSTSRKLLPVLLVSATLLLQACGGGGGGVASSGSSSQLASGVVTGFGSVFVDGVEIEDAQAAVQVEGPTGRMENTVLQMGQHVRVSHDGKGTASKVLVDAAVIGQVTALSATGFTVAAQAVSINNDATLGPVTVWGGGYTDFAGMALNDLVEVHGGPVYDATTHAYQVVATRVQKLTAISHVQVRGQISVLDTTAKTFQLNGLTVDYSAATLRPVTATLADGQSIVAYADYSALTGNHLAASNIKLDRLQDTSAASTTVQLSGLMSNYDAVAKTFDLQGVQVAAGGAVLEPATATLNDNAYVSLGGTVGSDGVLTATRIKVRQADVVAALATVRLVGVISDFVDNGAFVVRGVPVDASRIPSICPGVTLANGVQVSVQAKQQADTAVVLATEVTCKPLETLVIRPVDGTVSSVNTDARTLVLTLADSSTRTVGWNENTTFVNTTSSTLQGVSVRVECFMSGTTLMAKVVQAVNPAGAQAHLDDDGFRHPAPPAGAPAQVVPSAWTAYRNRMHR